VSIEEIKLLKQLPFSFDYNDPEIHEKTANFASNTQPWIRSFKT